MMARPGAVPVPFLDGPLAGIGQDVTPVYLCKSLRTVHPPLTADDIGADDPARLFPNTRWHVYSTALVDSTEWPADVPPQGPGDGGWGRRFVGQLEESEAVILRKAHLQGVTLNVPIVLPADWDVFRCSLGEEE
jgi:hypothetical protein